MASWNCTINPSSASVTTRSSLSKRCCAGITRATLHELRALGVRISLDDFGVGYASVGYLRAFPFDKIKIDRSFVRDVVGYPEAAAIVRAIATLSESLDISITAEGVETEEQ